MFDETEIAERIGVVAAEEMGLPQAVAKDVAFHMTDWLDDLEALVAFFRDPGALPSSRAAEVLTAFLVHAPNHIAAAAKLYTGFPVCDVFQVGALHDEEDDTG